MMQYPISKLKAQALIFIGANEQRFSEGFG
jgi:hypothetical protein